MMMMMVIFIIIIFVAVAVAVVVIVCAVVYAVIVVVVVDKWIFSAGLHTGDSVAMLVLSTWIKFSSVTLSPMAPATHTASRKGFLFSYSESVSNSENISAGQRNYLATNY